MKTFIGTLTLALVLPGFASAQKAPTSSRAPARGARDRGFLALNGGIRTGAGTFSDTFTYQVNVEDATTAVRYASKAAPLIDIAAGVHLWKKTVGLAVAVSRASVSAGASTESQIPHPFFDNRDRQVSGPAGDLARTETAAHVQLYYLKRSGKWQTMLTAGPSYFNVEQDVVTGVTAVESFPFDTATFQDARTKRGNGSAAGFNVGVDVGRMFSTSLGAGVLVRYSRGSVNFNVGDGHTVSADIGGVQAGAGLRFKF
ncbi:MAG: hypothetical protein H0U19_04840 [Acidobacteria bacterium]|nr:hypothetical protein [Acidobacteriota bacterium]